MWAHGCRPVLKDAAPLRGLSEQLGAYLSAQGAAYFRFIFAFRVNSAGLQVLSLKSYFSARPPKCKVIAHL